jgi:cytochrome c oxidase subunit 1
VALPAFGIVSDLISTHARKNIFGYRMMVWAILIIGGLSFVVWAHHMYVSGMNPYFGFFFATTTLIIAVPTAIKVYNWVLTLWRGNIRLTVPMLFAIAFIFTFVNGGLTGLFLGNVVVDLPLSDTYVRGGALPHGDGHRAAAGGVRGHLPLVPEDHRPHAGRPARQDPFLVHLHRHLRDLLPDALPRLHGHPAALLRFGGYELHPDSAHLLNTWISVAALRRRRRADAVPLQPGGQLLQGPAGRRQPVGAATLEWQTPERRRATATSAGAAGGLPLGL